MSNGAPGEWKHTYLAISCLGQTVFFRVKFAQMSAVPGSFFHHQGVSFKIDSVVPSEFTQGHSVTIAALRHQRKHIGRVVSRSDKPFHPAPGTDPDLPRNSLSDVSALFVYRELE